MRKILRNLLLATLFIFSIVFMAMADQPPDPGGGPGGGDPVGGGSPIGGGFLLMVSMAVGYSIKKIFDRRKKLSE
jgi:hypothetical protein